MPLQSYLAVVLIALSFSQIARGEVIEFSATWCKLCKTMAPVVTKLREEGLDLETYDVDRHPRMVTAWKVKGIPCFIALDTKGAELRRIEGVTNEYALRELVNDSRSQSKHKETQYPLMTYEDAFQLLPVKPLSPATLQASIGRVSTYQSDGISIHGTGTLIYNDGARGYVVSNNHVVSDPGRLQVKFPEGEFPGVIVRTDPVNDLSLIRIASPKAPPIFLSRKDAEAGENLTVGGYGEHGNFQFIQGNRNNEHPLNSHMEPNFFEIIGHTRQGDSGGPVINSNHDLVGVLWGSDGKIIEAVNATTCRAFLGSLADRTFPDPWQSFPGR